MLVLVLGCKGSWSSSSCSTYLNIQPHWHPSTTTKNNLIMRIMNTLPLPPILNRIWIYWINRGVNFRRVAVVLAVDEDRPSSREILLASPDVDNNECFTSDPSTREKDRLDSMRSKFISRTPKRKDNHGVDVCYIDKWSLHVTPPAAALTSFSPLRGMSLTYYDVDVEC